MSDVAFLDTETTGLSLDDDIWEIAVARRGPVGRAVKERLEIFVEHDLAKCARLPEPFLSDHQRRYDPAAALPRDVAARAVVTLTDGAHVAGAVPSFDTERVGLLARAYGLRPAWHYHLIDVEILAVGYLAASGGQFTSWHSIRPPWESEVLSRAVGVDPDAFARHTAMGDVEWAMAIYDAVLGDAP